MRLFKTTNFKGVEIVGFLAFIGVILVQRFIRPNLTAANESIKFILGIFPNFFAGIGMTIALFIYQHNRFKQFGLSQYQTVLASTFVSITGLWLWEYAQTFTKKEFDWHDVLASIAGSLISLVLLAWNIRVNATNGIRDL